MNEDVIEPAVRQAFLSPHPEVLETLFDVIAERRFSRYADVVRRGLSHTSERVCEATLLAAISIELPLSPLEIKRLSLDQRPRVRRTLLDGAREVGWPIPEIIILEALRSDDKRVRLDGISAARTLSTNAVRAELLKNLRRDKSEIISTFRRIGVGTEVIPYVRNLSRTEIMSGEHELGKIVFNVKVHNLVAPLQQMLSSPDALERLQAAWILNITGGGLLQPELSVLAMTDRDVDVRLMSVQALKAVGTISSSSVLQRAARDADTHVRQAALEALAIDPETQFSVALLLARDSDASVRLTAARILRYSNSPEAQALIEMLREDPNKDVREFLRGRSTADVLRNLSALSPEDQARQLCIQLPGSTAVMRFAMELLGRGELPELMQNLLIMCLSLPGSGQYLDDESVAIVRTLLHRPGASSKQVLNILQGNISSAAAAVIVDAAVDGIDPCTSNQRLKDFPPTVAATAVARYSAHPNPKVRARALECLGLDQEPNLPRIAVTVDLSDEASLDEIVVAGKLRSPTLAPRLLELLRNTSDMRRQWALRSALWMSRSTLAYEDAIRIHSPIKEYYSFSEWTEALLTRPTAEGLRSLLTELDRSPRQLSDTAASSLFQLSAEIPDAAIDWNIVLRNAKSLSDYFFFWVRKQGKTFSPIAFTAACVGSLEDYESAIDFSDFLDEEPVRVLQSQKTALKQAVRRCLEYHAVRGSQAMPSALAAAVRLFLNAGMVQDALQLQVFEARIPFGNAFFALSRAEALLAAGHIREVAGLLDQVENRWLPSLCTHDRRGEVIERLQLLRGLLAQREGRMQDARRNLVLVAKRALFDATAITALGNATAFTFDSKELQIRWVLQKIDPQLYSSPLLLDAIERLHVQSIETELRKDNIQLSLAIADRLLVLRIAREEPSVLSLQESEKGRVLAQLRELQGRVSRLSTNPQLEIASRADVDNLRKNDYRTTSTQPEELAQARQALKSYATEIKSRFPTIDLFAQVEDVDVKRIRANLSADQALIQYLLLPSHSFAWVVTRDAVRVVRIPQVESEIHEWIDLLRRDFGPFADMNPTSNDRLRALTVDGVRLTPRVDMGARQEVMTAEEARQKLSSALITPLLEHVQTKSHWVIVPHGGMHKLPFAVLDFRPGMALVQVKTLSILSSASRFSSPRPEDNNSNGRLLALGDPIPPSPEWERLAFARIEAQRVAEIYGVSKSTVLIGEKATSEALRLAITPGTSLHLALHGEVRQGDQSRLVLTDGYLSLKDIWALSLDGSSRVVLSACETGLGQSIGGNEILSLANGFIFAGARSVVSSLWRVPDKETLPLMEDMYLAISNGMSTSEALAVAQRKAIDRGATKQSWAAFVVNGI